MSRIRIRYFGPIKEGNIENQGWIDIKKVTLFIGDQGSGKSTIAKLISTMKWIEKAFNRGDLNANNFHTALFLRILKYQRINNYFDNERTIIQYEGDCYRIEYNPKNKFPFAQKLKGKPYVVPKIMYVPAERNFLSSVSESFNITGLIPSLFTFAEEVRLAQKRLQGSVIKLPVKEYRYQYNEENDTSSVIGEDHRVNLLEASSGLQSMIPLFIVSRSLARIVNDDEINEGNISVDSSIRMNSEITELYTKSNSPVTEIHERIKKIRAKFISKCFINIVEEPEQNLYPNTQQVFLNTLLAFNNLNDSNHLVVTTHSPYLINYLTHAVKAYQVLRKINSKYTDASLIEKLDKVFPVPSSVSPDDWIVYELNRNGSLKKLQDYKGLPSDENFLNERLADTNDIFAKLLEIEDQCRTS